jgi:hypothetical protein
MQLAMMVAALSATGASYDAASVEMSDDAPRVFPPLLGPGGAVSVARAGRSFVPRSPGGAARAAWKRRRRMGRGGARR